MPWVSDNDTEQLLDAAIRLLIEAHRNVEWIEAGHDLDDPLAPRIAAFLDLVVGRGGNE